MTSGWVPRGNSHLQIWSSDRSGPVGCGFILDGRHLLTCAHVVGDALGRRDALRGASQPPEEPVLIEWPGQPRQLYNAHVVRERWRAQRATDEAVGNVDDVAVLVLDEGSIFPAGTRPIVTVAEEEFDETLFAYGASRDLPFGVVVEGRFKGRMPIGVRGKLTSQHLDDSVRPGCSGSAVWSIKRGGVIGMIVEMQQSQSGLFMPIEALQADGVWDFTSVSAAVLSAPAPAQPLPERLRRVLHRFDRVDQLTDFEAHLTTQWDDARRPLLCTIAGRRRDRLEACRDKCKEEALLSRLGPREVKGENVKAMKLPWPDTRFFRVDAALTRLKIALKVHLKAGDCEPATLNAAYRRSTAPHIFFAELEQAHHGRGHVKLLQQWSAFWKQIGDEGLLDKPLVFFLLVTLSDQSDDPEPDYSSARRFYRSVVRVDGDDAIGELSLLKHFDAEEVETWLVNMADDLRLTDAELDRLRLSADSFTRERQCMRFEDLVEWVTQLPR